jgi:hypothetical protein
MEPSPRVLAGRNGDAQCLAASVSESGHEGRWSVECLEGDERLPVSLHRLSINRKLSYYAFRFVPSLFQNCVVSVFSGSYI